MKKPYLILILILSGLHVFSQDYDLVVTNTGDSIACHIDSITDNVISFEMKCDYKWFRMQLDRDKIKEYKYKVIDKKAYKFKTGSSYIERKFIVENLENVRRNSISLESNLFFNALNYERLLLMKKGAGITVGSGVYYRLFGGNAGFSLESNLLLGRNKHFFQIGLKTFLHESEDELFFGVYPGLGYRFQGVKGFLFKANLGIYPLDGPIVAPTLSLGYCF